MQLKLNLFSFRKWWPSPEYLRRFKVLDVQCLVDSGITGCGEECVPRGLKPLALWSRSTLDLWSHSAAVVCSKQPGPSWLPWRGTTSVLLSDGNSLHTSDFSQAEGTGGEGTSQSRACRNAAHSTLLLPSPLCRATSYCLNELSAMLWSPVKPKEWWRGSKC